MKSRYDYMRESPVKDIDGENFPDPLTVDYQAVVDQTLSLPATMSLSRVDLKRFWVKYYKTTNKTDLDDVLLSINNVEHFGVLEPEDTLYLFDTENVPQFSFKDLE